MKEFNIFKFLEELENGTKHIINEDLSLNIENKQNILKVFAGLSMQNIECQPFNWHDKIPLLNNNKHFRCVPGAIIRRGAYIENGAIIMPSFINIGAHIGQNTMVDSGVTIGSCAYIGKNCHISSNTVIAGVLEPVSAMPVIIEDDVFIGAQCLISEGIRIKKGSVIAAGTILTASTKIFERESGQQVQEIPENSLVIPSSYKSGNFYIKCALIAKTNFNKKENTDINEFLRSI